MSELVSAENVRSFYRGLWASEHDAPAPGFLADGEPLPPFLCRSLAFGDPAFADDCSWADAMTGSPDGVVRRVGAGEGRKGLCWGVSGISPLLHDYVPIAGHSVMGYSEARARVLEGALTLLGDLGDNYLDTVCDFIGLVLWLDYDRRGGTAEGLIASSFPGLPHCVVATDSAAQAIIPNEGLQGLSPWALAESLYHESLHQVLSATVLQDEIFVESFDAASAPKIRAEWRNADWPLDRGLHALFVYAGLSRMRQRLMALDRLEGSERETLSRAHSESSHIAGLLADQMDRHRAVFTAQGDRLLTEIRTEMAGRV
jgi:hypothetical protein